jgi:transcription elongation factor GreA
VGPNDHQGEQIAVGSSVRLWDIALEEELTFTLVGPDEANPAQGRISIASPTGRALLGRRAGDEIHVQAPAGVVHYRILHTSYR